MPAPQTTRCKPSAKTQRFASACVGETARTSVVSSVGSLVVILAVSPPRFSGRAVLLAHAELLKRLVVLFYAAQGVTHRGVVRDTECKRLGGASAAVSKATRRCVSCRTRSLKLFSLWARHALPAASSSSTLAWSMGSALSEERYKSLLNQSTRPQRAAVGHPDIRYSACSWLG